MKSEVFNFNHLCGLAVSRLGLSASDFYELTPGEFYEALYDQQQREKTILEVQTHTIWESSRNVLFYLERMNPYVKKKAKRVTEIFSLPWDKAESGGQTIEQMKQVLLAIHEHQKHQKPIPGKIRKRSDLKN